MVLPRFPRAVVFDMDGLLCDTEVVYRDSMMEASAAMADAVADAGYLADIAPRLMQRFMARDLLIRPLGNTVYVMPPYCATGHDLELVYDVIRQAVSEALA